MDCVPEAAGGAFDSLNLRVDGLRGSVRGLRDHGGEDALEVVVNHRCGLLDRLETAVAGPWRPLLPAFLSGGRRQQRIDGPLRARRPILSPPRDHLDALPNPTAALEWHL